MESRFYFYWSPIAFCAVSCALSASCLSIVTMRRYKWKLAKRIFCSLGGLLLGLVPMLFLWYFAGECAAFGKLAIYLGIAVSDLLGAYAGSMIARTDAYSAKLGEILGFKDFLVFTEKDRIEALLEEQPELFYRLLPYAQVLGVTEKWTEKFEGIDLAPPTYYSCSDAVFSAVVWNSLFRSMNAFGNSTAVTPSDAVIGGGTVTYPGAVGSASAGYPSAGQASTSSPASYFAEVTSDLEYADGSLGTLSIPSIGVNTKIFEGTTTASMAKGAAHFEETSIWNGNVCLAGHNRGTNEIFGKIHTLKAGDTVTLTTKLGTRTYAVVSVEKISETDRSGIVTTVRNQLTLYTCVMNERPYRWCVTAVLLPNAFSG